MKDNFDIAYLRKYVNGELSPKQMYAVETASQNDEMLMDIITGLELERDQALKYPSKEISSFLYERTHMKTVHSLKRYMSIGIAASLLLVLGLGTIWFLNKPTSLNQKTQIAQNNSKEIVQEKKQNNLDVNSANKKEAIIEGSISKNNNENQKELANLSGNLSQKQRTLNARKKDIIINPNVFIDTAIQISKDDFPNFARNKYGKHEALIDSPNLIAGNFQIRRDAISARNELQNYNDLDSENVLVNISPNKKQLIVGSIVNKESGSPVSQATIRNVKTNEIAITDSAGQFILPTEVASTQIEIRSIGFKETKLQAESNLKVELEPEDSTLDEVVINENSLKTFKSEPLIGWRAYKRYLSDRSKGSLYGKGEVTLIFDISDLGRPVNIQIIDSASALLNDQALEIIKKGPDWKKGNDEKKVKIKISFKD